jgi:hypothetical protein
MLKYVIQIEFLIKSFWTDVEHEMSIMRQFQDPSFIVRLSKANIDGNRPVFAIKCRTTR